MTASSRINPAQLAENGQELIQLPAPSQLLGTIENIFIAGALIIPMYFTLSTGGQIPRRDFAAAQAALQTINTATQQVANKGGEVLFISQRHLLTFDEVQNVPLVPEDELVFLMEMAMSDNRAYLDAFNTGYQQSALRHDRLRTVGHPISRKKPQFWRGK